MLKKLLYKIFPVQNELKKKSINLTDTNLFYQTFRDWINSSRSQKYSSWVFDCIDIWGKHFAKVDFKLFETGNEGTLQVVNSHPILDIFQRPNNFQTWWEIKYRIAQHFALYGNSYFLKLRDRMDVPRELIQLLPDRIEPKSSKSEWISHYEYYNGKEYFKLNKNDIIHLRYPDPNNLIKGRAIISNILDQSEVDLLQTSYQKKFYKEGGFLGLTFTTNQTLNEASFDRAKKELSEQYAGGYNNAFKVALFEQGLQPIKSAYSIKDMDIKVQRELTRDEIAAAFQVSQFLLGMGELINRATAETALFQFISGVVEPIMIYIEDVFTKELAHADFGNEFFVKHDISSLRDIESDLKYYENGLQNGWLTVNEVRKWEDLEPINN